MKRTGCSVRKAKPSMTLSAMDGHRLNQLRKTLQALKYKEALDDSSAPLVDKLVADLLHTTDSYRDLKLQVASKSQEIQDGHNKVCAFLVLFL